MDHPRSRGVYSFRALRSCGSAGSSPLAQGLQGQGRGRQTRQRIIPARAGFTTSRLSPTTSKRDHPRSRGVYDGVYPNLDEWARSSPLARGLRHVPVGPRGPVGIIPARAGFTLHHWQVISCSRDHPRSRGVYHPKRSFMRGEAGSSPLARGLPPRCGAPFTIVRIIPARAGFTAGRRMRV